MHVIELHDPVADPDDGLLLGNGDLSVSVYQRDGQIVFRFGKGDVWDRRLDLSDDPKPAHVDEIARGIRDEGWVSNPYDGAGTKALHGTKNPQRMHELCQGVPPSYNRRPYPCPKPVGELATSFHPSLTGVRFTQRLAIEEATLHIAYEWAAGTRLNFTAFVHPHHNCFVLHLMTEKWAALEPLVAFQLYRWSDPLPSIPLPAAYNHSDKTTPLAPPRTRQEQGEWVIEQAFPADPTFPQGFRYLLAPLHADRVEPLDATPSRHACLQVAPSRMGADVFVLVGVTTSSDPGGPERALQLLHEKIGKVGAPFIKCWEDENRAAAQEFWSRSSVKTADPLWENLWYETLHIRRCAYRADTVPPGLFLPSTVNDYSHWHGDYHTNYNFQQPFWGDYAANHLDVGDAYFDAMKYFIYIGRKIARDYYGARGAFIQLTGYPILAADDPLGCVPMGRMAYMTGWALNQYWWRYLYTLDLNWLRATGYPAIREGALFYTDFLKKWDDGLYHAFPSNQGEDGFNGETSAYTDRPQVIRHARYLLRAAVRACEALGTDDDLRKIWKDILTHLAPESGTSVILSAEERTRNEINAPEFMNWDGSPRVWSDVQHDPQSPIPVLERMNGEWEWYCGKLPLLWMNALRQHVFVVERDLPHVRKLVERNRQPNGILRAMAADRYGHAGGWTEALGIIAPLQEMMLQSWDGAIRVFPVWPKELDASFKTLRAEGAFLVSAAWTNGEVSAVEILSERGARCRLRDPWPGKTRIVDRSGKEVSLACEKEGIIGFPTQVGESYQLCKR